MRTRRSPRNQQRLFRAIGRELERAAMPPAMVTRSCGHACGCKAGECPCSTPGECPASWETTSNGAAAENSWRLMPRGSHRLIANGREADVWKVGGGNWRWSVLDSETGYYFVHGTAQTLKLAKQYATAAVQS